MIEGKLDEAIAEYRAAKRLSPGRRQRPQQPGKHPLRQREDFDSAIAEFTELYRQNPEWEGGHNCLARAYMSKRDYPSAIRELQAAIASNPTGAAEHRVLGQALLLSGKEIRKRSRSSIKAVTLNPESSAGTPLSRNRAREYPATHRG